ncbi:MAG: peptide chain release factor N(5)-glutamine methyltransferase [Acidobacteriota bacterium]
MSTVQDLFRRGRNLLHGVPAPWVEAKVLLLEATGMGEVEFLASPGQKVPPEKEARFFRLVRRRLSGFPLAWITRKKEFWSLPFQVLPGVFIPRPESELLVEKVLELSARQKATIVDIGTGCGNIALALAKERPRARIIATDVSVRALKTARMNALRQGRPNVTFILSNLFSGFSGLGLEGRSDFIVSNPPYVSAADWEALPPEVKNHEPRQALVGGKTGLEFIQRLIEGSCAYLRRGAFLLFEVGQGQAVDALRLFDKRWAEVGPSADLRGIPRAIKARKA